MADGAGDRRASALGPSPRCSRPCRRCAGPSSIDPATTTTAGRARSSTTATPTACRCRSGPSTRVQVRSPTWPRQRHPPRLPSRQAVPPARRGSAVPDQPTRSSAGDLDRVRQPSHPPRPRRLRSPPWAVDTFAAPTSTATKCSPDSASSNAAPPPPIVAPLTQPPEARLHDQHPALSGKDETMTGSSSKHRSTTITQPSRKGTSR